MKTNKRQPISNTSFLGFEKQTNKSSDSDLVSFIVTLIAMDKQHKEKINKQ